MPELKINPAKILVGPTAVGKTDVIHELATRHGFSIISADAMMVYEGMDIGTAKPTSKERGTIPYAGIDLVKPDRNFSVYDYLVSVDEQTASWAASESECAVVGGTGLYVRCLLSGLDESDGPSSEFRLLAEAVYKKDGLDGLRKWCREKYPEIDEQIPDGDLDNPRRWIRAVERGDQKRVERMIPPNTRIIGLARDKDALEQRIIKRVNLMYASGLLEEVTALRAQYPELSLTAAKAIGYAEAIEVLDGAYGLEEAKKKTIIRTRQYAKRQMTWFRNQFNTQWVPVADKDSTSHIADQVMELWCNDG